MNAPTLLVPPEVLLGLHPADQSNLYLATEGVQRYVWQSAWGAMLIEVRDGTSYVNGSPVAPMEALRAPDSAGPQPTTTIPP